MCIDNRVILFGVGESCVCVGGEHWIMLCLVCCVLCVVGVDDSRECIVCGKHNVQDIGCVANMCFGNGRLEEILSNK